MAESHFHRTLKKKLRKLWRMVEAPQVLRRDEEFLHRLRVGLKEWRAALRLLHGIDPEFPQPQISERFEPVFQAAGGVRFWQLQRRFLRPSDARLRAFAGHYRAHIRSRLRQERRKLLAAATQPNWPDWRELKREAHRAVEACTPKLLQAYFDELQLEMQSIKAGLDRRRPRELHELRKCLREYADNRKLVSKHLRFDPGPPRGLAADSAAVVSLLGDWHDQEAACRELAGYLRSPACEGAVLVQGKGLLRSWRNIERKTWNRVMTLLASA